VRSRSSQMGARAPHMPFICRGGLVIAGVEPTPVRRAMCMDHFALFGPLCGNKVIRAAGRRSCAELEISVDLCAWKHDGPELAGPLRVRTFRLVTCFRAKVRGMARGR